MTHWKSGTRPLNYYVNPSDPRNLKQKEEDLKELPQEYQDFYREVSQFVPYQRIFIDPLYTLGYGIDASFYRLIPKIVIRVLDDAEMGEILRLSQRMKIAVTFRTAGTSLSGQALTDSVLLVLQGSWRHYKIHDHGKRSA